MHGWSTCLFMYKANDVSLLHTAVLLPLYCGGIVVTGCSLPGGGGLSQFVVHMPCESQQCIRVALPFCKPSGGYLYLCPPLCSVHNQQIDGAET